MPRTAVLATVVALAVVGAVGCGDEETTVTEARTVTETDAQDTEPTPVETEATAETGNRGPRHFQTPSGNIGCYLDGGGARCDIRERGWTPPPTPASCAELDYGQGLTVDRDGASFVCAGDTTLGGPATLDYGSSAQRGRFLCESESSGVTCTDVNTGAGFFISRARTTESSSGAKPAAF